MDAQYSSQDQTMPKHEFFSRAHDKNIDDMLAATSRTVIRSDTTKIPYPKREERQEYSEVASKGKRGEGVRKSAPLKKAKKAWASKSVKLGDTNLVQQNELKPIHKGQGYLTLSTNSTEGAVGTMQSIGVAVVVNCLVKWIKFQSYRTEKSYVEYELKVRARTKHLKNPEFKDGCSEFTIFTRYSELLKLKEKIEQGIKIEMQRRGNDPNYYKLEFPKFPPKRVYQKSDHSFIERRMFALELYFEEIFDLYGEIVNYLDAFIDFLKPMEKELCILGDQKSGKSQLFKALYRDLFYKKEERISGGRTSKGKFDAAKIKIPFEITTQSASSLFEEQSKSTEIRSENEADFDPRKAFPLDTVINDQLYRLEVRQFERAQLDICQVLSYCKQAECILFFLINPLVQSSALFIKPYILQWLQNQDKKQEESSCAVLNLVSGTPTQRSQEWDNEVMQIRNSLHKSNKKGLYAELDVSKKGSTHYILSNVLNQEQRHVIKT